MNEAIKRGGSSTFSGVSIKDILRNPTYIGKIRWGHRKDWGILHEDNKRKRKYDDNPIISNGIHEAIIDEVTFNKVQEHITNNSRHHLKRFNGNHLLSGLLRCPVCDYGMSYQPVSAKGKTYGYYICNQYMNHKRCKPNGIRKDKIEEEFLTIFERIVNEPEFRTMMRSSLNNSDEHVKELENGIKRKENDINRLRVQQEKFILELTEGDDSYKAVFRKKVQGTIGEISALENNVENTKREIKEFKGKHLDLDEVFELFENVGKIIRLLEKEAQQSLVRKLITSINVQDKHISEINFSFQQSFRIGGGKGNRTIHLF